MNVFQMNPVRWFSAISIVMPKIDPEHVRVIPVGQRVEGIDEAVASPGLGITLLDRCAEPACSPGEKRERTACRAWDHAAIEIPDPRRASPGLIAGD